MAATGRYRGGPLQADFNALTGPGLLGKDSSGDLVILDDPWLTEKTRAAIVFLVAQGATAGNIRRIFEPCATTDTTTEGTGNGGTITANSGVDGGCFKLSTSMDTAGVANLYAGLVIASQKAVPWYASWSAKFNCAPVATAKGQVGLLSGGTGKIGVGVFSAVSTAKFSAQSETSGGAVTSTALSENVDTSFHDFDMKFDGSNAYVRIDGGTWQAIAAAAQMGAVIGYQGASVDNNSDTAVDRLVYVNNMVFFVEGN